MSIFNFNSSKLIRMRQGRGHATDGFLLLELMLAMAIFVLISTLYATWSAQIIQQRETALGQLMRVHELYGLSVKLAHGYVPAANAKNQVTVSYQPITYLPHAALLSKYRLPPGLHAVKITAVKPHSKKRISFDACALKGQIV